MGAEGAGRLAGSKLQYWRWCYAVSGTKLNHGTMHALRGVQYQTMLWCYAPAMECLAQGTRYAMSGTELGYATTRRAGGLPGVD
eukprot:1134012-Rhodomonas_salina.4